MDGPRDCYSKSSKSEREKQILYDITYMQNLKYDKKIYLQNRHREQTCGCQGGGRGGGGKN